MLCGKERANLNTVWKTDEKNEYCVRKEKATRMLCGKQRGDPIVVLANDGKTNAVGKTYYNFSQIAKQSTKRA